MNKVIWNAMFCEESLEKIQTLSTHVTNNDIARFRTGRSTNFVDQKGR